jgi:hypothetical protein
MTLRDTQIETELLNSQVETTRPKKTVVIKSPFKVPKDIDKNLYNALCAFLTKKVLKSGNYIATENALVFRSLSTVDGYNQDVLCIRLTQDGQDHYIGNSSRLAFTGTKIAFGRRIKGWGTSEAQRTMEKIGMPMLPFTAFHESGLKVTATKILNQSGPETVKRHTGQNKKGEKLFTDVHFTGATLFKNETSCFLFDIDRVEIDHGIFNPFIVQLPRMVESISEAYDSLIPLEVRTAKIEGKEVLRQGEHFFIKVADYAAASPDKAPRRDWMQDGDVRLKEARLSAQGNRDHVCSEFNETLGLVSGFVRHQGREHLDLNLRSGWWRPVPNTAVKAFTISGDID